MPKCPFATWKPITGNVGPYVSGPFKIVHHTTEGSSAKGAFRAYKKHRSDPHFTVDSETIYQHIDTALSARSLRNKPNTGIQTNKDSALQIEVVGFAHLSKDGATLENVARLCRWLEALHNVPLQWPNGLPKVATPKGKDPGGHNRNAKTWNKLGGHYGHSQVHKNTHWDPAYSKEEVEFLMEAEFDELGQLRYSEEMIRFDALRSNRSSLDGVESTMQDHDVLEDDEFERY